MKSLSSTEIYTQNSIEQLKQTYHKNHPRKSTKLSELKFYEKK